MGRILVAAAILAVVLLSELARGVPAEPPRSGADDAQTPAGRFNLPGPTLGGKQFWSDLLVFRGWRIQRNAMTGHCRLLDDANRRRAWGTYDQCRQKLTGLKQSLGLRPVSGRVVIVLHGLGRSRSSMQGLCDYLATAGEFTVLNVSYASTRGDLDEHADALARVIENLDPTVQQIDFVAHSLGNLVIRRYLRQCDRRGVGGRFDRRIGRIVMLGPPNRGARLAQLLARLKLAEWILGDSAAGLAEGEAELQDQLATPRCPFGIIAGGQGDQQGRNRLLAGDDDLIVRVQETKLVGAGDFAVLPVYHGRLMDDATVRQYTLRFLQHGFFRSEAQRRPITDLAGEQP